jgi:HAD superfamily hydrolase (TIGR01509 family)
VIRALVFDFDGLILDTEAPAFVAWQEVYRAHGCDLPLERWAACIGHGPGAALFDPYAHLEELLGRGVERARIKAERRVRCDALIAAEVVRPGVEAWIAEARSRGIGLAVASSSPIEWVEGHLIRLGLREAFAHLSCAGPDLPGKPAPDVYLAAAAALDVSPDAAIAVEDSPTGARAAKAAGMFCVAVPNSITGALDFSHADLRVESLTHLHLADAIAQAQTRARQPAG